MKNKIIQGNCYEILKTLQSESVNCCVTSSPYWGLRDYDTLPVYWPAITFCPMVELPAITIPAMESCHGMEPNIFTYIAHEVLIFREVKRVLRADGTLWINLGDGSVHNGAAYGNDKSTLTGRKHGKYMGKAKRFVKKVKGLPAKNVIGIPWRVAFALQADGWILRREIIWSKPNPLPEAVKDACSKSHEYIFHFSKSKTYYYDADSIAEPYKANTLATHGAISRQMKKESTEMVKTNKWHNNSTIREPKKWPHPIMGGSGNGIRNFKIIDGEGKANKKTVWTVPVNGFKGAHFATFPEKLIVPCILAGCPPEGLVLDPFGGAGTTALVSRKLNRNYLLIELNKQYIAIAKQRLRDEIPLFM